MLDLNEVQRRTWENKLRKGFNTTDVQEEIILMLIEIGEATDAWMRGDQPGLADELADAVIFAVCVARMAQVELPDVLLSTSGAPEMVPVVRREDAYQQLLLLFGEGAKAGAAWRFQDLDALVKRIDRVITAACRLAQMYALDLVAAIEDKMAVNDARAYVRDPRSGHMVKA